jgi:hypothetical protein
MRRTVGALLTAAALLAVPVPANAGGPTSVLITDPTTGAASALYYTDSRYAELDRLLQAGEPTDEPEGQLGSRQYTVTWMLHDVQVWRTDSVYPDARGGPLVMTSVENFETGSMRSPAWTRLTDGKPIAQLLGDVLGSKSSGLMAARPASPPVIEERIVTETETVWFSLEGWRWVLPGLLLGLVAGAGIALRRRPIAEPRRMLVDRRPAAHLS